MAKAAKHTNAKGEKTLCVIFIDLLTSRTKMVIIAAGKGMATKRVMQANAFGNDVKIASSKCSRAKVP